MKRMPCLLAFAASLSLLACNPISQPTDLPDAGPDQSVDVQPDGGPDDSPEDDAPDGGLQPIHLTVQGNLSLEDLPPHSGVDFTVALTAMAPEGSPMVYLGVYFDPSQGPGGDATWTWRAMADGALIAGGTPGEAQEVASGVVQFDGQGQLVDSSQISHFEPPPGGQQQDLIFDMGGVTHLAGPWSDMPSPPPAPRVTYVLRGNLDARTATPVQPWDPTDPASTANYAVGLTLPDHLGRLYPARIHFRADGAGAWEWHVLADGSEVDSGTAGTATEIASGTLAFDQQGRLTNDSQASDFLPVHTNVLQELVFEMGDPLDEGGTGLVGVTQFGRSFASSAPPVPTATITLRGNLSENDPTPAQPWDLAQPVSTSNAMASVDLYDSLGVAHPTDIYFRNDGAGHWEYHMVTNGGSVTGGAMGTLSEIASGTIVFDGQGLLDSTNQTSDFTPNDAVQPQFLFFDFGDDTSSGGTGLLGVTQSTAASDITVAGQDGSP
jgi:hypothetical protein